MMYWGGFALPFSHNYSLNDMKLLKWNGTEDTLIRTDRNGDKVPMKAGGILEVTDDQAEKYLKHDKRFTIAEPEEVSLTKKQKEEQEAARKEAEEKAKTEAERLQKEEEEKAAAEAAKKQK